MARIDSQLLFLTTSPRTPEKMIPEIELLIDHFAGSYWNNETQNAFMEILRDEQFFNGTGEKDPAFSARDRINRAPKISRLCGSVSPYFYYSCWSCIAYIKTERRSFSSANAKVSSTLALS